MALLFMSAKQKFETTASKKLKNGEYEVMQQLQGGHVSEAYSQFYRLLRFREDGTLRRLQQLSIGGTTLEEYDEEGKVETRIVNGMIEKSVFDEEEKRQTLTLEDVLPKTDRKGALSSTLKAYGGERQ